MVRNIGESKGTNGKRTRGSIQASDRVIKGCKKQLSKNGRPNGKKHGIRNGNCGHAES